MVICQNKDCCCSACTVLHQAKAIQGNTSTTDTSYRYCSQAEKHLIQQMIALIDSAWAPSSHYDGKQREDILARLQALAPSPTQFQAQLATRLIRTHSWRIYALRFPCPVVAKTTRSLAVVLGCMSRYLSAGNGRSDFHILLFNEHSALLSNGALIGSHVTHHLRRPFGRQYQSHITQHHLHILASSQAQSRVKRSTWCAFVPRLCDSLCNDAIISSCGLVIEGRTEGRVSGKGQYGNVE